MKYSVLACINDIVLSKDETVFCIYLPLTENQLLNRTEPLNASNGRPDTPLRPSPGSNPNKRAAPSARPSSPIPVSSNTSTTTPAIKKLGGADTELANNIGGSIAEVAKKVSPASVSEMKANSVAKVQQSHDSCLCRLSNGLETIGYHDGPDDHHLNCQCCYELTIANWVIIVWNKEI